MFYMGHPDLDWIQLAKATGTGHEGRFNGFVYRDLRRRFERRPTLIEVPLQVLSGSGQGDCSASRMAAWSRN
jgi:hypothetical protein